MRSLIKRYEDTWRDRGYPKGIPDSVPNELMNLNLAPSYKAVAICILKNDHSLSGLGFKKVESVWYGRLKKEELGLIEETPLFPEMA